MVRARAACTERRARSAASSLACRATRRRVLPVGDASAKAEAVQSSSFSTRPSSRLPGFSARTNAAPSSAASSCASASSRANPRPAHTKSPSRPETPSATTSVIPLSDRPFAVSEQPSRLLAFFRWACWVARASNVSLPSKELHREALWLLEDAGIPPQDFHSWRFSPSSRTRVGNSEPVPLRASVRELQALWRSRLFSRVPYQQLVSGTYWRDLFLYVDSGVLAPRPETEVLTSLAISLVYSQSNDDLRSAPLVDVGTGAGPIALSLLKHTSREVLAVDTSEHALSIAASNADRHGLRDRLNLYHGFLLNPLLQRNVQASGIVANLPYVPPNRMSQLQPEVTLHEPHEALDGGSNDGSQLIRNLIVQIPHCLMSGGFIVLETDAGEQAHALQRELTQQGFSNVQLKGDYNGAPDRFLLAQND